MPQLPAQQNAGAELVPGLPQVIANIELGDREKALPDYAKKRLYYDGQQYDEENDAFATQAGYKGKNIRLPEHLRKHAYSSHVQESIDILADQLAEGIQFDGPHADLLNQWWNQSMMVQRADDWFREALILGDVYGVPDWDPVADNMEIDIWEAESIWPVYSLDDWRKLDHWYRFTEVMYPDGSIHEDMRVYVLEDTPFATVNPPPVAPSLMSIELADDPGLLILKQVVEYVFIDREFTARNELRLPRHILTHAQGDTRHSLRTRFGNSMITTKVMGSADRYNAISQLGFRVARQNSFATIAVVGDASALGAGGRDSEIAKDVADVLRFPGGTGIHTITLPTDPRMIESQQHQLERNLYREFGLSKTDLSEFGGLGTVSGYALEVMNRKDRATQNRIIKTAIAGIKDLGNAMLDMHAIRSAEAAGGNWWEVDPLETYPDRDQIQVIIGSGDVVDTVSDRDDFVAGLVSRPYVLRRRGMAKKEIAAVEVEINQAAQQAANLQIQVTNETAKVAADLQAQNQAAQAAAQAKAQQANQRTVASASGSGSQSGTTQRSN